jgi:hypothetical protein
MRYLVSQDRCQTVVVRAHGEDAGEDEDLSARENEGVLGLLVVDYVDL